MTITYMTRHREYAAHFKTDREARDIAKTFNIPFDVYHTVHGGGYYYVQFIDGPFIGGRPFGFWDSSEAPQAPYKGDYANFEKDVS